MISKAFDRCQHSALILSTRNPSRRARQVRAKECAGGGPGPASPGLTGSTGTVPGYGTILASSPSGPDGKEIKGMELLCTCTR